MRSHDKITLTTPDAPVIFADLPMVSCSVCAPDTMTEAQIVAFANAELPRQRWHAVYTSIPNPCNQVAGRRHWLLMANT